MATLDGHRGALARWLALRGALVRELAVAVFIGVSFAGCSKPPEPGVTLQYYLWGSTYQAEQQQRIVDAFERANPGIKIELKPVLLNYSEKLQTLIVGGVMPDVMTVEVGAYYEWADRGVLSDLTDVMEGAAAEQHFTFMPIVPEQLRYHGRYYAVPYLMCGTILQVNLDMFRRAGVEIPPPEGITWDWIAKVAPQMSRRAGNPQAECDSFMALPDMASMLFSFGAKVFDDPRNPSRVVVNSPEAEQMCRYVRRAVATKAIRSRMSEINSSDASSALLFLLGKAPVRIMGLWARPGQPSPDHFPDFDWDVRPFPAGPRGQRVTANGAYLIGVSAQTKHPEEARRFARFYLSEEAIRVNARTGDYLPLFRELVGRPSMKPPDPRLSPRSVQYYADTMEAEQCLLPVCGPGLNELRHIIDSRLSQVASDPGQPIPVILATLQDEVERWLKRQKAKGFYL